MGHRRGVKAAGAVLALLVVAAPARAAAGADQPGPPKLAFTGDTVEVGAGGDHSAHVVIKNTGGTAATLQVRAVSGGDHADGEASPSEVGAGRVEAVTLSFKDLKSDDRTGTVIVTAEQGGDPAVAKFNVTHRASHTDLVTLVLVAMALALVVSLLRLRTLNQSPTHAVPALDPSWKLSDSLTSNLTALGGAAAAVLGTSGAVADVLGPFSTTEFTLLNLVWLGMIALGPVVYAAARVKATNAGTTVVEGTVGGLLLAAWLTTAAVFGELLTLGAVVVTATAGPTPVYVIIALAIVALVVAVYVWRSLALILAVHPPKATSDFQGIVTAAAAPRRSAML